VSRIGIAMEANLLTGELRITGRVVDEKGNIAGSTWRNGGEMGNSPAALQDQPEYDTELLQLVRGFIGDGSAEITSIAPDVLNLKAASKLRFPKVMYDIYRLLRASADVRHVGWGDTPKAL